MADMGPESGLLNFFFFFNINFPIISFKSFGGLG
jgi:hypothetical protein